MSRPHRVVIGDGREVRVMEEPAQTAPLGLRCWDAVLDRPITDGLVVHATPAAGGATTRAGRSSSGVLGFASLPTTRAAERRPVSEFAATDQYIVDVFDSLGRFAPIRVLLDAPTAFPDPAPIVLFPSANRPTPDGFATVRATVGIENTSVPVASGRRVHPAAYAVLTVTVEGVDHVGVADRAGQAVVFVPFDQFAAGVAADPPVAATARSASSSTLHCRRPTARACVLRHRSSQPTRAHLEGPMFRPDHTFEIEFGPDLVLDEPRPQRTLAPGHLKEEFHMPEYLAPGVFVEETCSARSRSKVSARVRQPSSVPTRFGPIDGLPELLTNFGDFERIFAGLDPLDSSTGTKGPTSSPQVSERSSRTAVDVAMSPGPPRATIGGARRPAGQIPAVGDHLALRARHPGTCRELPGHPDLQDGTQRPRHPRFASASSRIRR